MFLKRTLLCACGLAGCAVLGEGISWRRAVDGAWNDPSNWNLGRLPASGDDIAVNAGGTYTVTLPEGDTVVSPYQFRVSAGNGSSITFDGRNGTFLMPDVAEDVYREEPWGVNASAGHFFNLETYNVAGNKRNAVVKMDHARFTVACADNDARLDVRDGLFNFYDPQGVAHWYPFTVGNGGQRDMVISVQRGARLRLPNVNFRANATRTNLFQVAGGEVEILGQLQMPSQNFNDTLVSTGIVQVTDGGRLEADSVRFGGIRTYASSNRTFRVVVEEKGVLDVKTRFEQPVASRAEVLVRTGGQLNVGDNFSFGNGEGATGLVSVVGATANMPKGVSVGGNGVGCRGDFLASNAVITAGASINVMQGLFRVEDSDMTLNCLYPGYGGRADSYGLAEVVGGKSTIQGIYCGLNRNGGLRISGGADVSIRGGEFLVGKDAGCTGDFEIADADTRVQIAAATLCVGRNGSGEMKMSGGSLTLPALYLGDAVGSSGRMTLSGGRVVTTGNEAVLVGRQGAAHLEVTGGELETFQIRFNWQGNANTPTSVLHQTGGFISVTTTSRDQGVNLCDSRDTHAKLVLDGGVFQCHRVRGWTGATARGGGGWSMLEANGGTIRAHVPSPAFIETIDEARLGPKGLTLDSAHAVTIPQNFENKAGEEGRLILTGGGVQTLAGTDSRETFLDVAGGTALFAAGAAHQSHVTVTNGATLSFEGESTGAAFTGLTLGSAQSLGQLRMELSDQIVVASEPSFGSFGISIADATYVDGAYPLVRYAGRASAETVRAWTAGYVATGRLEGKSYRFTVMEDAEGTAFNLVVGTGSPLAATSVWNGPGADWAADANWLDVIPGAQATAVFSSESAPSRVTVPADGAEVGALSFTAAQAHVIEGPGALRLADTGYGKIVASGGAVTVAAGLELPAVTPFSVAEATTLTLDGAVRRGGIDKRGTGSLVLRSPENAFPTGIYVEDGLLSVANMGAFGAGPGGLGNLTLQGGSVEVKEAGVLPRTLSVQADAPEKAVVFKADADVTVPSAVVTGGALIKRGAGTVTFDSPAGMVLSAGNGTCALNGNPSIAPVLFPENGVVPTEGYAGFNVADGEVVFRGGTYTIPNAICVGLNSKNLSDAEPAFTVDGARVETGMNSYHFLLGPNAYALGAKFTRPRLTIRNGGYLSCNTLNTGKLGDYDIYPEILLDNGTLYGSWTINISERGNCHATYTIRNGSRFLAKTEVNWRGEANLTFTDSVFAQNDQGALGSILVSQGGNGTWLFGPGSEFRCGGIRQQTNNKVTFAFAGGRWIPSLGSYNAVYEKSDRITIETRTAAGLRLAPVAGAEYRLAKAITGAGGMVMDGAGTLRFVTQEIIQGAETNKMETASAAIHSPYTLDFEETLEIQSGTVVVEKGAARPNARFAGAGTLSAVECPSPVFELELDEDLVPAQVLTLADFTSTGRVTVDLGRTAANPLPRGAAGILVARYTGAAPDLGSWKVAGSGLDCVAGAFTAGNGEIRLAVRSAGAVIYVR